MSVTAPRTIIDLQGIADLLGVSRVTPQQWRHRRVLPPPDIEDFPDKPMWYMSTIVRWAIDTERWPPGRVARPARNRPPGE